MGAAAAAAIIRREKKIVAAFRAGRATSADQAATLSALNVHQGFVFWRLHRRAVVRDAPGGKYYLDELSWEALRHIRRRLLTVVLVLVLIATIGGALLIKS